MKMTLTLPVSIGNIEKACARILPKFVQESTRVKQLICLHDFFSIKLCNSDCFSGFDFAMIALSLLESGEISDVSVEFDEETFHLHKFPLILKLNALREHLISSKKVQFPYLDGGVELFMDIVGFCYGKELIFTPGNVAFLSNAANILDMSGVDNLITLTDDFIEQIISEMKVSQKYGPVIVALAFAASLKEWEASPAYLKLYDAVGRAWIRVTIQHEDRPKCDPILTEFLTFLPENVIVRLIQDFSISKPNYPFIADLVAKFFALRFSLMTSKHHINGEVPPTNGNGNESFNVEDRTVCINPLRTALANSCLPLERLSINDRKMLEVELTGIDFEATPIDEVLDSVLTRLPADIPLAPRLSVDWCKQVQLLCITTSSPWKCF